MHCFDSNAKTAACAYTRLLVATLCLMLGQALCARAATEVALTVKETSGVSRSSEIVENGIPIPKSLNVLSTSSLGILDPDGTPVPADFKVLARWHAARSDSSAPIQWVLATFPATVVASGSATYKLVISTDSAPTSPSPLTALTVNQEGDRVTIGTGQATFVIGDAFSRLFDEVRNAANQVVINGGSSSADLNSTGVVTADSFSVDIERQDRLTAVINISGSYTLDPVGEGGVSVTRRYVFRAGSPTALVRQVVSWEGDLCGQDGWDTVCDADSDGSDEPNGVLATRIREDLSLGISSPVTASIVGSFNSAAITGTVGAGQTAQIRQNLRDSRAAALSFSVAVPGASAASGAKADGGLLAASGANGAVAVAFNHMHRYEPQAISLQNGNQLHLDLVSDKVWLGQRQGMFASFAVSALNGGATRDTYNQLVWAPLNHPLRAWPTAAWFAASKTIDEVPVGTLPTGVTSYDTLLPLVLSATTTKIDEKGLAGMMTFGVYPRYWGNVINGDELDCGDSDPTPADDWDDLYWCATWTDYHNTTAAATYYAMRSGEVQWLDELGTPAALRTLYTQIMQCSDGDDYFYCGQAPAGYNGYRSDFNSSHAYLDNLFLYYWLSGDYSVVRTVERGASSMRDYLCAQRPDSACLATDPPTNEWAHLAGRTGMQWLAAFRFVGLASDDVSYLEDYVSGISRAVTQYYVEGTSGGTTHGFWTDEPVLAPGTHTTAQLWLASLYDMNLLHRLQLDTDDAAVGEPALTPSRVQDNWGRTLADYGAKLSGDGTAAGTWPNQLRFTWSGSRIGGTVSSVQAVTDGDDPTLYDTGKAALSAALSRAAAHLANTAMQALALDVIKRVLNAAAEDGSPLGKVQGEYLSRLHPAIAALAVSSPAPQTGVTIVATDASASERNRNKAVFTITRPRRSSKAVIVKYRVSGTARNGTDYNRLPGVITFKPSAKSVRVSVVPVNDKKKEATERVTLTLLRNGSKYTLGTPKSATARIADND